MTDVHLMVYLGTLGVFLVCALVLAVLMVLILAAAAVAATLRGRRQPGILVGHGGQAWFWRQERRRPARVLPGAGPAEPVRVSGSYLLLPPADDPRAGDGREEATGAGDGRH